MAFQVIPAIDVAGGRLARLTPEGPVRMEEHDGDPVAAARAFLAAGAHLLHVVDLDLAFSGEAKNASVLTEIARSVSTCRPRGRSWTTARSPLRWRRGPNGWCWDPLRSTTSAGHGR